MWGGSINTYFLERLQLFQVAGSEEQWDAKNPDEKFSWNLIDDDMPEATNLQVSGVCCGWMEGGGLLVQSEDVELNI